MARSQLTYWQTHYPGIFSMETVVVIKEMGTVHKSSFIAITHDIVHVNG